MCTCDMKKNVYSNKSHNLEPPQMPINNKMDKQVVDYLYNEKPYNKEEKEWMTAYKQATEWIHLIECGAIQARPKKKKKHGVWLCWYNI